MGCGMTFSCVTCRKSFYLGYRSYTSWTTNPLLLKLQTEHEGHETYEWSEDFTDHVGPDLHISHYWLEQPAMIPDEKNFEQINLDPQALDGVI